MAVSSAADTIVCAASQVPGQYLSYSQVLFSADVPNISVYSQTYNQPDTEPFATGTNFCTSTLSCTAFTDGWAGRTGAFAITTEGAMLFPPGFNPPAGNVYNYTFFTEG